MVLGLAVSVTAGAQTATLGQWSGKFSLPLIAIHMAMLPTGKVLIFSAEHGVPGIHAWTLDPKTLLKKNVKPPAGWNLDCAGHAFFSDGRLLVSGGTLSFKPLRGSKRAYLFDPWTETWGRIADMRDGRWYPSNLTLPDGAVLTMAGRSSTANVENVDIELWDPRGTNAWKLLGRRQLEDYPLLHLLPDGNVFMAGPAAMTERYNPATNRWTKVTKRNVARRFEAPSVLVPPYLDRVMVIGGFPEPGSPTGSAEIIDLSSSTPAWTVTRSMGFARYQHDAVVLPDGKILVVGGKSNTSSSSPKAVFVPETYDPSTGNWTSLAPHQVPRMYHSTALLLPDGRVLAAGGDRQASGEIYSPPYLFRGTRPTISDAPAAIAYGKPFRLGFTSTTTANTVVLIRLSSVTHSINMGQRYVRLAQLNQKSGTVTVAAPKNGATAPPGYYMLFVVSATGVPSVSRLVRVAPGFGQRTKLGGAIRGTKGLPVHDVSGMLVAGSRVSFDLGNALPGSTGLFVISTARLDQPLLGGVLVPRPDIVIPGVPISNTGTAGISVTWPTGVPTGASAYSQFWFWDKGAPQGVAASNGVRVRTP